MIAILMAGCCAKQPPPLTSSYFFHKLDGKPLVSYRELIEEKTNDKFVLFLFNLYDCESCIEAGLHISKTLDSFSGEKIVIAISTMGNPSRYQIRTNYLEYIYEVVDELVRKELKFVPTPMLFIIENDEIITSYFPPDTLGLIRQANDLLDISDKRR